MGLTLFNHKLQCLGSYSDLKVTPENLLCLFLPPQQVPSQEQFALVSVVAVMGDQRWGEGRVISAGCVFMLYDRVHSFSYCLIYFDFNAYDIFSCQNLFIFFKVKLN